MLSRILPVVVSVVAGGIFVAAASAAPPDDDPGADAASSFLPDVTVAPPTDYPDVRLFNGDASIGQAAFNPACPKRLVVGIASVGNPSRCYVRRSADGGRTWGALVPLPQFADAECADEPAVVYAAGGRRLYAAYPYIKPTGNWSSGVAFSLSTDDGATWSSPTTALPELDVVIEGYRDVRLAAAPGGGALYAAAFWTHWHGRGVFFSSSGDQGSGWTPSKSIAGESSTIGTYLSNFALAAGRGGNVLVAYGFGQQGDPYPSPSYSSVEVARSADHGASFLYGSAEWSDDFVGYPDIKIGPFGTAHLVYAKGSNPGAAILYKYSLPPYGSWSAMPVRLDDDVPQAHVGAPRLAVGGCGRASVLHATWTDFGDGTDKVLYTRKVAQPGYPWSEPLKVGTLKDGIREHGLAAAGLKAFSIFSGRTAAAQDVIAGSRVSSGVTCP